jgi:hypothetical protein
VSPANSEEISWFYINVYEKNLVLSIDFDLDGFSSLNEEAFAFSIFDNNGNEVLNQTMVEFGYFPLYDEAIRVFLNLLEEFHINPDEIYTLKIYENSFESSDGTKSGVLTCSFLPSDYIYISTAWEVFFDNLLFFLRSSPILEFIFARLIVLIEFFRFYPFDIFFPIHLLS